MGVPRADRNACARRQDGRPALCRAELGAHRRQRGGRKGRRQCSGQTASDIPWLKLEVTAHRGGGVFSGVSTVQRINTAAASTPAPATRPVRSTARPTPRITCSCARGRNGGIGPVSAVFFARRLQPRELQLAQFVEPSRDRVIGDAEALRAGVRQAAGSPRPSPGSRRWRRARAAAPHVPRRWRGQRPWRPAVARAPPPPCARPRPAH